MKPIAVNTDFFMVICFSCRALWLEAEYSYRASKVVADEQEDEPQQRAELSCIQQRLVKT